jgi:hypothetical protein
MLRTVRQPVALVGDPFPGDGLKCILAGNFGGAFSRFLRGVRVGVLCQQPSRFVALHAGVGKRHGRIDAKRKSAALPGEPII